MMKHREVIDILEELAPLSLACDWDNSGLQTGDRDIETRGIYVALDATSDTVDETVKSGCNLLITHHPLLFCPIKSVTADTVTGRLLTKLIRNDITCYSMHTSYDKACRGMSAEAAYMLGLRYTRPLIDCDSEGNGLGCIGALERTMSLAELAGHVKEIYGLSCVTYYGDPEKQVRITAILPGSGRSEWQDAMAQGADVYVSGDFNYHSVLDAVNAGFAVIDAGHEGIEKLFVRAVGDYLVKKLNRTDIVFSQSSTNIAYHI